MYCTPRKSHVKGIKSSGVLLRDGSYVYALINFIDSTNCVAQACNCKIKSELVPFLSCIYTHMYIYTYNHPLHKKLFQVLFVRSPSPHLPPALCLHDNGTLDGSNRSKLFFTAHQLYAFCVLIHVRLAGETLMSLHFSANQVKFSLC